MSTSVFFFHRNWSINYELHLISELLKMVNKCDTSDTIVRHPWYIPSSTQEM